jgi:hypothetical protein
VHTCEKCAFDKWVSSYKQVQVRLKAATKLCDIFELNGLPHLGALPYFAACSVPPEFAELDDSYSTLDDGHRSMCSWGLVGAGGMCRALCPEGSYGHGVLSKCTPSGQFELDKSQCVLGGLSPANLPIKLVPNMCCRSCIMTVKCASIMHMYARLCTGCS